MIVENFKITPNYAVEGERVKISFSLTVQSGDEVNGLRVFARFPGFGGIIYYSDHSFRLAAGKSPVELELEGIIPYSPSIAPILESNRFIKTEFFEVQLGNFGTSVDVDYAFSLLNKKYIPKITAFEVYRHTDGEYDDEGEQVKVLFSIAATTKPKKGTFRLLLYYQQDGNTANEPEPLDFSDNILEWLNNGAVTIDLTNYLDVRFDKNSDWAFHMEFGDQFELAIEEYDVPMAFANLHLSGASTGGACFGGFSKSTEGKPLLESYYPFHAYAGIAGVTDSTAGEVQTGLTWIDGKPIHRFIATGKTALAGAQAAVATLPSTPAAMLSLRGMLHAADGWKPIPYAYYGDADWNSAIYHEESTNSIFLSIGREYTGEKDFIIIAEYTKNEESE